MDGMQSAPNHELPKPIENQGFESGFDASNEKFGSVTPELHVAPMPGERLAQVNNAVSQAAAITPQIQLPVTNLSLPGQPVITPVVADDNDVIEKEWVDKAKEIVSSTQGDPHAKSNQLSGLKKEYIHKRYGKDILVAKDEA
jgi:hypothetical protein